MTALAIGRAPPGDLAAQMTALGQAARAAALELATTATVAKDRALVAAAAAIRAATLRITASQSLAPRRWMTAVQNLSCLGSSAHKPRNRKPMAGARISPSPSALENLACPETIASASTNTRLAT